MKKKSGLLSNKQRKVIKREKFTRSAQKMRMCKEK